MSVDVATVAFGVAEGGEVGVGFFCGAAAGRHDGGVEGFIDIDGHAGGVAADVEDGTGFEPLPEIGGFFEHAVLDVDFAFLVAAEGGGEFGEGAVGEEVLPFLFVEEVGGGADFAEEEPCFAAGSGGAAFFEEGAEGGDASAWAAHDDGGLVVRGGEAEAFAVIDEAGDGGAGADAFGEPCGGDPFAVATVALVADGGDGEVDLVGVGAETAADGVETDLDLFVKADEFLGLELCVGEGEEEIDDLAAVEPCVEGVLVIGAEKRFEGWGGGGVAGGDGGEEFAVRDGDGAGSGEGLADGDGAAVEIVDRF